MGRRVDWVSVPDLELEMASVSRSGSSEEEPRSASRWVRPSALAFEWDRLVGMARAAGFPQLP